MKKTIAILLVLVIGMVGVFAADPVTSTAAMDITTEISRQSKIILSTQTTQGTGYSSFFGASAITPITSAVPVATTAKTPIGNLHYFTNSTTGLTATITATQLVDTLAPEQTGTATTTPIKYTVYVGNTGSEVSYVTGAASGTMLPLVASGTTGTTIGVLPMNVQLDETDFNNAAVATGTYTGTITFTYTSN